LLSAEVVDHMLTNTDARPKDRDDADQRIVGQARDRKGRIIDSQAAVGGYPEMEMTRRKLRVPEESVEAWLTTFAAEVE